MRLQAMCDVDGALFALAGTVIDALVGELLGVVDECVDGVVVELDGLFAGIGGIVGIRLRDLVLGGGDVLDGVLADLASAVSDRGLAGENLLRCQGHGMLLVSRNIRCSASGNSFFAEGEGGFGNGG